MVSSVWAGAWPEVPILDPMASRSVSERIELPFAELRQRAAAEFDAELDGFYTADEVLEFETYAPSGARRLLIYLSPKSGAGLPEGWDSVLEDAGIAWVGGLNVGNDIHVARRVGHALLAPFVIDSLEPDEIYLLGFSGGGRVASMMMPAYPERFGGAIFVCGANPLMTATRETLQALADTPLVFLTGTGDFNLDDTRMAVSTFHQAGLRRAELMIVEGLDHALPGAADFRKSIDLIFDTKGDTLCIE